MKRTLKDPISESDLGRLITCEFDMLILPSISHSSEPVSLLRQKINGRINSYHVDDEVCLERTFPNIAAKRPMAGSL